MTRQALVREASAPRDSNTRIIKPSGALARGAGGATHARPVTDRNSDHAVAYAAFTYYPQKSADIPRWTIDEDVAWCMQPLDSLSRGLRTGFADRIRLLIIDPEQNRHLFIQDLNALESPESKFGSTSERFRLHTVDDPGDTPPPRDDD